ncbi:MAG: pirin family protein [Planctomycetota bacterium]
MLTIRHSGERGTADHGWLLAKHSFSFAEYHDSEHMGFRSLRVLNEDLVQPGQGFPTHGHHDMEILTWVLAGALEHKDSLGHGEVLRPGEIQAMSAGTGVRHSESNPSPKEPLHLLQIWIVPERRGLPPSYEQRRVPEEVLSAPDGRLALIAAPVTAAPADSVRASAAFRPVGIHQDVRLYAKRLAPGQSVEHPLMEGRAAWIQVARGALTLTGDTSRTSAALHAGDGAAVSGERALRLSATEPAEVLLFDLA